MSWKPDAEERRYVECTASMAIDSLRGQGVVARADFVANLRAIANGLEKLPLLFAASNAAGLWKDGGA